MSKPHPTKTLQNKYKNIIMERLATNQQNTGKKNHSQIHSLKTQCTPNDKTQDIYEKIFEDFDSSYKSKYKPIILNQKPKPVGRCLYPQIIQLSKKQGNKTKSKFKFEKGRACTQMAIIEPFEKSKISCELKRNVSKSNLNSNSKKKSSQHKGNPLKNSELKRQSSLTLLKNTQEISLKRSESKKDLLQARKKRCQTMAQNFKMYSVKNLKSLLKKQESKKI